jgi:4-hydroxythreonine-4-phosphate dehydrogenase
MPKRIVITCGDVNGIGLRCLSKAIHECVFDSELWLAITPSVLQHAIDVYDLGGSLNGLTWTCGDQSVHLHVLDAECTITPGMPSDSASLLAIASLDVAIAATVNGTYDAVVTLPINKHALSSVGWPYPGQTEMLGAYASGDPLMVLCTHDVRVALATVHVPLRAVADMITPDLITVRVKQLTQHLQERHGIEHPSVAVLAVNPHAGDNGVIGDEDQRIVEPTIRRLRLDGFNVDGPHPADGFFAFGSYTKYDGILAMYHDQGLIPLKLLAQGAGVNVTAGLSIVRTSPDHGTAYDRALAGDIDAASTRMAIEMAELQITVVT